MLPSDIVVYGSADMPETDGATIGGAADFTPCIAFYEITPAGSVDVISSSLSDTATTIAYSGRDSTGAVQSQTLTLNRQSWVTGSQSFEAAALRRIVRGECERTIGRSEWYTGGR